MGEDDALWPRCRARCERYCEHVILVVGHGVQAGPGVTAQLLVIFQSLQNSLIKLTTLRAVGEVGVLSIPSTRH